MTSAILATAALAATWFVSPKGDDANDGSRERPVKTVEKAVELSRGLMRDEAKTIVVADGLYCFERTVWLRDSDNDLEIRAENPGKAVLSGARPVTGWKADPKDKRFLVADFPFAAEKDMLYTLVVNGAMADFSCYPEYDSGRKLPYIANYEDASKGNRTVIRYDVRTLPKGYTYEGLDLESVFLDIPQEWASTRTYIATNDWRNGVFHLVSRTDMPIGQFNQGYLIRNLRMGMTHPGTWMFEASAGKIYYWPKDGEKADSIQSTVSCVKALFAFGGARGVTFSGLVLEGCKSPFRYGIYGNRDGILPALIGGGVDGVRVSGCELRNTSGDGICFVKPHRTVVEDCYVHHLGNGGVRFEDGGSDSEIRGTEVCYNGRYSLAVNACALQTRSVRFVGNKVHHTTGVGACFWTSDSFVASNEFHHTMQLVRDGGAVYGAMVRTSFLDNYCHDLGEWPGLYNDEGGMDCVYAGNRFESSWWPFHMHDCRSITFTNNVISSDYAMRYSFQGSTHCVFKDNKISAKGAIDSDVYVENCDTWDNDVRFRQPDGNYGPFARVTLERPVLPRKEPAAAVRVLRPPVKAGAKGCEIDNGAFRSPWSRGVDCNRDAEGRIAIGVPGTSLACGFDDEFLYLRGYYKYNQFCGYLGSQSLGHVWGVHDGVRLSFQGFDVDVFTDGTVVSSDGSLSFDTTNTTVRPWGGVGEGQRLYALKIPLSRLGIDGRTAEGREIPFNATFYNADHREYKYYEAPEKPGVVAGLFGGKGNVLTGRIRFEPFRRDVYSLVSQKAGSLNGGNVFVGAAWPFGMLQPGPDTVARAGDGYGEKSGGFDANHDLLMGVTQTHLSGYGRPDMQDFLLLPFTGDLPKDGSRPCQRIENVWDSPPPARYWAVLERWALFLESTASRRCAYHRVDYGRGGRVKVLVDARAGALAPGAKERLVASESTFGADGVFEGHNRVTCWRKDRDVYAKIAFSPAPVAVRELPSDGRPGARYVAEFELGANGKVVAKVALSGESMDGARRNFDADPADFDFDARKAECEKAWRDALGRFSAEGDGEKLRLFYTSLYRLLVQPALVSDAGAADAYEYATSGDAARVTRPWMRIFAPGVLSAVRKSEWPKGEYKGRIDVSKVPGADVGTLCDTLFTTKSDGLPGNDEGGRLSAWYAFACLGIYPTSESGDTFAAVAPQLEKVSVALENGKTFSVVAKGLSKESRRVKSVAFNGQPLKDGRIGYDEIMAGGELVFEMCK